MITKK